MMIFRKAIPRRIFLRGVGAAIALPLLDGMVPALAGPLATEVKRPLRVGYIYVPNGIMRDVWLPSKAGANFEMTPVLKELAPFRDQLLVLSNLDGGLDEVGGHVAGSSMWLTASTPKKSLNDVYCGVSVDQVIAKEFGKETQLESLELCIENAAELAGQSAGGYNSAYTNTITWRSPTTPLPMEHQPRAVFERLFGDGDSTDPAARLGQNRRRRSILDFVSLEVNRLLKGFDAGDRSKLSEFLDAIRDVEKRIQKAEQQGSVKLPEIERPTGIPPFEEHVKLMFDLQLLAYQTDITRVITFMMSREFSELVYTNLVHTDPHHPLTHHRGNPKSMLQAGEVNIFHAKLLAYFLEKMRATPDGDGSLLDHSMIVYGAGMGDGDIHSQLNMPIAVFGGASGKIKGGRYIRYPEGTPFSNLHLAMLNIAGIPTKTFGDSTGVLDLNSAA